MMLIASGLVGFALAVPAMAEPAVAVVFVAPDSFVDARQFGSARAGADKSVLRRLRAHFERLGERHLTIGQSLTIKVLQVDLAGFRRAARSADAERIATDADWPSVRLHYVLAQGGVEVLNATETVADPDFLRRGGPYSGDSLRYEKRMLDAWFQARIVERKPAPR